MNNFDIIFIKQLQIDTIIGIYDFEQQQKQALNLDLEIYIDRANLEHAAKTELIEHTIDYEAISNQIIKLSSGRQYQLIETLAIDINKLLFEDQRVQGCKITIDKPQAIAQATTVGVQIVRYRN